MPRGPCSQTSFDHIYDQWFTQVARWVRAFGVAEADHEDVVHDVFMVVHRRLPEFDGQNVTGWLYQIARRKARDHRRLTWFKHITHASKPLAEHLLTTDPDALVDLETQEARRLLARLLETLNPDQSAAFVLFEIEGNTGEQIARLQGVPINTVWARIHKARHKLRERLEQLEQQARRSQG